VIAVKRRVSSLCYISQTHKDVKRFFKKMRSQQNLLGESDLGRCPPDTGGDPAALDGPQAAAFR
jgi:hypothetical protein